MAEHSSDTSPHTDPQHTGHPAVGIRLSPDVYSNAVAGAILRAQRHGHHTFVIADESTGDEALAFAHQLGAYVIESDSTQMNGERIRDEAARVVRASGFPGLIWQEDPTARIDFVRSTDAVLASSAYVVEPARRPVVDVGLDVLVAIPAYNEADMIADVVHSARQYAGAVLVVDDGSDDETAVRATDAGAKVVKHATNRGYGAALKTAFREADRARVAHLVVMDGDGQHDPADIPRLLETQTDQAADIVIGSRFGEEAETDIPFYRRVGLVAVTMLTNLSLGVVRSRSRVQDTQSGFRLYTRDAIASLTDAETISEHMGASTDILYHAHAQNFDIAEVGTTIRYDVENRSNRHPFQHGLTLVLNLIQTVERQRPIATLGIPGFISAVIGLGLGYWTVFNYLQTGTFPIGWAFASSFFALAGIFAAFTAIILHSLNTQLPHK